MKKQNAVNFFFIIETAISNWPGGDTYLKLFYFAAVFKTTYRRTYYTFTPGQSLRVCTLRLCEWMEI
jgi:hypothetical protein